MTTNAHVGVVDVVVLVFYGVFLIYDGESKAANAGQKLKTHKTTHLCINIQVVISDCDMAFLVLE